MRKNIIHYREKCVLCGGCSAVCPQNAITLLDETELEINDEMCKGCYHCTIFCPMDALGTCGEDNLITGKL